MERISDVAIKVSCLIFGLVVGVFLHLVKVIILPGVIFWELVAVAEVCFRKIFRRGAEENDEP